MNVSTIKSLAWSGAAALTAALGWTVYQYVEAPPSAVERFDKQLAQQKLNVDFDSEPVRSNTVHATVIDKTFYDLNWTGELPPEPVDTEPEEAAPKPQHRPVEDLARILLIQQDSDAPAESSVLIAYKPAAQVTGYPLGHRLQNGDALAAPHDSAIVESISASEGVTFRFETAQGEDPREKEVLRPADFEKGIDIAWVGDGDPKRPNKTIAVRRVDNPPPYKPAKTTPLGPNHFQIGTEDAFVFGEDAAGIIAREVRHRRHRNPRTGKFDGIELQEVKAGGMAARHGAQEGDVIKSINGHPVTSPSEAITYVKNNEENTSTWVVEIENKGRVRTVTYESPPQ